MSLITITEISNVTSKVSSSISRADGIIRSFVNTCQYVKFQTEIITKSNLQSVNNVEQTPGTDFKTKYKEARITFVM